MKVSNYLTVLIMTYNEEENLPHTLRNISELTKKYSDIELPILQTLQ